VALVALVLPLQLLELLLLVQAVAEVVALDSKMIQCTHNQVLVVLVVVVQVQAVEQ
jgi:hypothetical protein